MERVHIISQDSWVRPSVKEHSNHYSWLLSSWWRFAQRKKKEWLSTPPFRNGERTRWYAEVPSQEPGGVRQFLNARGEKEQVAAEIRGLSLPVLPRKTKCETGAYENQGEGMHAHWIQLGCEEKGQSIN